MALADLSNVNKITPFHFDIYYTTSASGNWQYLATYEPERITKVVIPTTAVGLLVRIKF